MTVVIIRKDLLAKGDDRLPTMLNYRTYSESRSLYNTPPTFAIYMLSLVLEWVEEQGGVQAIEKKNAEKRRYYIVVLMKVKDFTKGMQKRKPFAYECNVYVAKRGAYKEVFSRSERKRVNWISRSSLCRRMSRIDL